MKDVTPLRQKPWEEEFARALAAWYWRQKQNELLKTKNDRNTLEDESIHGVTVDQVLTKPEAIR